MLKGLLADTQSAIAEDSKSTAGDKHETSRAMAQLEQEKLGKQILETERALQIISGINPKSKLQEGQTGAFIQTTLGDYYLSIGLGQMTLNDQKIFCLSPASPLGHILLNKKKGDTFSWQNKEITILDIA